MIKQNLDKLLFVDVETAGISSSYYSFENEYPVLHKMFGRYQDYLVKRFPEVESGTLPHLYSKAALIPEFGRVVCISFGILKETPSPTEDGVFVKNFIINSYAEESEHSILVKFKKVLERAHDLGFSLVGHNIKKFDVPFISTRMLINGISLPQILPSPDTKPWESKLIDTKELWQFGNFNALSSLDLICATLNIDSPKVGEVVGEHVHNNFWNGNIGEIVKYCEKDVKALYDIVNYLKNLK